MHFGQTKLGKSGGVVLGDSHVSARMRAADKLVDLFERDILSGALTEGATLPPEREIVQAHGVSRTVVREAVLALANKGLVAARPGYRPVVVKPGFDTAVELMGSIIPQLLNQKGGVRNLFDLRIMMEASLVRQAATEATATDIQKMKDALARNGEAIMDSELFYETDIAFHGVLYEIPKNPALPAIHRAYTTWLAPHWRQMPRKEQRNTANHAAHQQIFEAVLMRDPDAAEEQLRKHLDSAWRQICATLEGLDTGRADT